MTRYIDQEAFETYNDQDGQETVVTQLVAAAPGDAFDGWIKDVWKKLAVEDIHPGQGRGMKGHIRRVPLGIHEEILSVGEPRDDDDDVIPSVMYKLRKYGPFPLKDHLGYVRFVKDTSKSVDGKPQTLVIWSIKTVPTTIGNVLFCGGSLIRLALRSALYFMLMDLASQLKKVRQD